MSLTRRDSELDLLRTALRRRGARELVRLPARVLADSSVRRWRALGFASLADYAPVVETNDAEYVRLLEALAANLGAESRRTRIRVVEAGEREQRFRQLAEHTRDVVWLTEWTTKQVLYVNPAYESVWGRSCESLYQDARSWSADIHPDDRERVVREFADGAENGTYDTEYRLLLGDTTKWIHDRAFPIRDERGNVYRVAGISEDVTLKRTVEADLRRARSELEVRVAERTQTLADAYDALRRLASEALLAEDRERRTLAVDLHDGLGQIISLIGMKLSAHRDGADDPDGALAELARLVEQANAMARSMTFQLSPPVLYDLGLEPALQWLCEDMEANYGLQVDYADDDADKPTDLRVRLSLFRAVRELLINVVKHADVNRASVSLARREDTIVVTVADAGYGFDLESIGESVKPGHGLFAIRERLRHLDGDVRITSGPKTGTRATLTAPLELNGSTSIRHTRQEKGTPG